MISLYLNLLICLSVAVDAVEYRLPKNVIPTYYLIEIQLDPDSFSTDRFEGSVNITLNVLQRTDKIHIHVKDLNITFIYFSKINTAYNLFSQVSYTSLTNIYTIISSKMLDPGTYWLYMPYQGKFVPRDALGLFKSTYKNSNGVDQFVIATQLQPFYARQVFPCFDEPSFKATFQLSLVYPKGYHAISNTNPDEKTEFSINNHQMESVLCRPTPVMASYLVAVIVHSDYVCDTNNEVTLFQFCSRSTTSSADRSYVLEISPKIMTFIENFVGSSYNAIGIDKMDIVTVPDYHFLGMENWGLITCRENQVLWNADESSNYSKQRVAAILAHEFSHMWFGNLVTMRWWDDLFLNEGFARYFEYVAIAELENWEIDKQFVIEVIHTALGADSKKGPALSSPVRNPNEVFSQISMIAYDKGGSIIRMIANVMGLEQFRLGIQHYIEMNNPSNAVPDDLLNALQKFVKLPYDFNDVVKHWITEPGHAVLNVKLNNKKIVITQERFLHVGKSSIKYFIPITYTTNKMKKKFSDTRTKYWLAPDTTQLVLPEKITNKNDWIILNNQQIGFYRVQYDTNLYNRIKLALKTNPNDIHVLNKAQIVDDLFNFAIANRTNLSFALDMTSFLGEDTDYYTWYSAFDRFKFLLLKINNQEIRKMFVKYVTNLMKKVLETVPFSDERLNDQIYTLKQEKVHEWACKLEMSECISNSREIFSDYKKGFTRSKNLKLTALCTSLRHSNRLEEDWNFLWNKFITTTIATEKTTILSALGCSNNKKFLTRLLRYAVNTSSAIRKHDLNSVFTAVRINSHPIGTTVALNFFVNDFSRFQDYFRNDYEAIFGILDVMTDSFTQRAQRDEVERFMDMNFNMSSMKSLKSTLLKAADTTLDMVKVVEKQLLDYFKPASPKKSGCVLLIFNSTVLIIVYVTRQVLTMYVT